LGLFIKSISKNAPRNRPNIGWRHNIDISGNDKKVKCNYCSEISGGIFRFKHHLVGTMEDFEPYASVSEEIEKH